MVGVRAGMAAPAARAGARPVLPQTLPDTSAVAVPQAVRIPDTADGLPRPLSARAGASVQSGHDRAPAGGMPTASQPYGGRMSLSHPVGTTSLPAIGAASRPGETSDLLTALGMLLG